MKSASPASYYEEARERLESPTFTVADNDDIKWRLHAYPKGSREGSEGHLSVYLVLASCNQSAVRTKCTFTIIDAETEKTRAKGWQSAHKFVQVRHAARWHEICYSSNIELPEET